MKIVGLDVETTGLDTEKDRIVEIYAAKYDSSSRRLEAEFHHFVNPLQTIGADAVRIHGITQAHVASEPDWSVVGQDFQAFMSDVSLIVAHNGIGFDGPLINAEMKRVGLKPLQQPIFDTFQQGRWSTPDGKAPNLGELCFACGVNYSSSAAHAADYDVKCMMECFFLAARWGFFKITEKRA